MHAKYFGFILVIWFPVVLHAQSTAEPCHAPKLDDGYFVPVQDTYPHEHELFYSCDEGHKPVVEGWWATSTCQNGTWDHYPQCIDVNGCLPLTVLNSKNTKSSNSWYSNGYLMWVNCKEGYKQINNDEAAECIDGVWNNVPVCERQSGACSALSKIPHAVIIHQEYRELYVERASVEYECEDGYTTEGVNNQVSFCMNGTWSVGPKCSKKTKPDGGRGVGTGGSHTTSGDRMTQPAGHRPDVHVTQPVGEGHRPDGGRGVGTGDRMTQPPVVETAGSVTTSGGRVTQPAHGGSSTTGGSTPPLIPVTNCGAHPILQHGDVVEQGRMYLKYKCAAFYTLVGPETVQCFSDGTWSQQPTCRDSFCVITAGHYDGFSLTANEYIEEGKGAYINCIWRDYFTHVQCINGQITRTRCCHSRDHQYGYCR